MSAMPTTLSNLKLRNVVLIASVLFLATLTRAQGNELIVDEDTNLRSNPSMKSAVITTIGSGYAVRVLRRKGAWYMVRSGKRVGWIHRNRIRRITSDTPPTTISVPMRAFRKESDGPLATTLPVSHKTSPFLPETIDADGIVVRVVNKTGRAINFEFGRVPYTIAPDAERTITAAGGNYEFDVFAETEEVEEDPESEYSMVSTVRSRMRDVKHFANGHKYTWHISVTKWYDTDQ